MDDLGPVLERIRDRFVAPDDSLGRLLDRARRRQRNRRLGSALVAAAVSGAAAVALWAGFRGAPPMPAGPIEVPMERAFDVATGEGAVWVARYVRGSGGEVVRVDPATGLVQARITLDAAGPIAVGEGSVWVGTFPHGTSPATLVRVDPSTNDVADVIELPELQYEMAEGDRAFLPNDVAVGFGRVWISTARGTVVSIDPGSDRVATQDGEPATILGGLAVGAGSVWAWNDFVAPEAAVLRIDPGSGRIVGRVDAPAVVSSVAADERYVWISHRPVEQVCPGRAPSCGPTTNALLRLEPATDTRMVSDRWPGSSGVLAAAGGTAYLGGRDGTVWAVEEGDARRVAELGTPIWSLAVDHGILWAVTDNGLRGLPLRGESPAPAPPPQEVLVYGSQSTEFATDLFVAGADGTGRRNLTNSPDTYETDPARSPDGATIAFSDGRSIWAVDADGTGLTRLTSIPDGMDEEPAWSPDGTRIAFTRQPTEGAPRVIVVMNADGSGPTRLTPPETDEFGPTWSPDGRWIAFARTEPGTYGGIWKIRTDGGRPVVVLDREGAVRPAWSPDGAWIAFDDEPRIWLVRPDGTEAHTVTEPRGAFSDDTSPAWSPDGTRLAFITGSNQHDIWIVNADGTGARPLVTGPANDYAPAWNPTITTDPGTGS